MTPRRAFLGFAVILILPFATLVARSPLQVTDNVDKLAPVLNQSVLQVLATPSSGTYRPLGPLMARAVVQLTGPHEATAFRLLLAAQIAGVCLLLAVVLPVTTWSDVAAGMLALSVLLGHHAFRPLTTEGYPLNHFALVGLYALLAVVLIRRPPRPLNDYLAAALALFAAFTLESGVLVTVIFLAARPLGFRGVSWRGVGGVVAALLVYLAARITVLSVDGLGAPLGGHHSGFGFAMLEADTIQARFGNQPWLWRIHNFVAAIFSVVAAEPREGRWDFVRQALDGAVEGPTLVEVSASCITTVFIAVTGVRFFGIDARTSWRSIVRHDEDIRLAGLSVAVIVASGLMCLSYVKEDILSTAAIFYAVATYVAVSRAMTWSVPPRWRLATPFMVCTLAAVATLWALRASDTACVIRYLAFVKRSAWAVAEASEWPSEDRALGNRFRQSYLALRVPPPGVVNRTLPCLIREP